MSAYTFRNYRAADFDKFVQFNIEAEKLEPTGRIVSPQLVAELLGRPNYSPEKDLFIAEEAGNIVGYIDVTPELTIGRVTLNGWVHPEHRRQGLASSLLRYAIQHARDLGARVAHVNVMEDNTAARGMLSKHGFQHVRRFLELRLDLAQASCQDTEPSTLRCHCLQQGEEDKLTRIQNRSFTGTWGYNLNTLEDVTYWTSLSRFSPEDVVLTCKGDAVVGYCWTSITDEKDATVNEPMGRIFMLGVDPDYRGRGAGKQVLLAGLAHLKCKGLRFVDLTVDSENEAACTLYRNAGFTVRASSVWYELVLEPPTG